VGIIGRLLDHAIEKHINFILETRKGFNIKVPLYNSPGDASVPCKDDRLLIIKIDGTGRYAALGMLVESQGAKPGEKIFYGRDADGAIVSKISMLDSGNIEAEADGDIKADAKKDIKGTAKNINLEAKTKATLKGADVELSGKVDATGGTFHCKGTAAPTGTGCLCAMPFCIVTAAPQSGEMASGT
jgi:hypothetical protein